MVQLPHQVWELNFHTILAVGLVATRAEDHHKGGENVKQYIIIMKSSLNLGRFPSDVFWELLAIDVNS